MRGVGGSAHGPRDEALRGVLREPQAPELLLLVQARALARTPENERKPTQNALQVQRRLLDALQTAVKNPKHLQIAKKNLKQH